MHRPRDARLNILDIEASGFGPHSYPIEVGVVLASGQSYCSLVAPAPEWVHWDADAERVHGVPRATVTAHGKPARTIASALNDLLAGATVYSDGWVVDKPWLVTLFAQARMAPSFHLSPIELILSEPQMAHWHAVKAQVENELGVQRHRASIDAWIVQETYARTRAASVA